MEIKILDSKSDLQVLFSYPPHHLSKLSPVNRPTVPPSLQCIRPTISPVYPSHHLSSVSVPPSLQCSVSVTTSLQCIRPTISPMYPSHYLTSVSLPPSLQCIRPTISPVYPSHHLSSVSVPPSLQCIRPTISPIKVSKAGALSIISPLLLVLSFIQLIRVIVSISLSVNN